MEMYHVGERCLWHTSIWILCGSLRQCWQSKYLRTPAVPTCSNVEVAIPQLFYEHPTPAVLALPRRRKSTIRSTSSVVGGLGRSFPDLRRERHLIVCAVNGLIFCQKTCQNIQNWGPENRIGTSSSKPFSQGSMVVSSAADPVAAHDFLWPHRGPLRWATGFPWLFTADALDSRCELCFYQQYLGSRSLSLTGRGCRAGWRPHHSSTYRCGLEGFCQCT